MALAETRSGQQGGSSWLDATVKLPKNLESLATVLFISYFFLLDEAFYSPVIFVAVPYRTSLFLFQVLASPSART